jgi:hypothetical protein
MMRFGGIRVVWKFILLTASLTAWAQPSMPSWLVPFPGAAVSPGTVSPGLTEVTYTAEVTPEDILRHYHGLFTAANLPFNPNFDGLGNTVRAAAPECDLLIKIREQSSGTSVKISCAAKSAAPARGSDIAVTNPHVPRALKTAEEIRQENEELARKIQEKRDAAPRAAAAMMSKFDRPVEPHQNVTPPALAWPHWLIAYPNGDENPCPNGRNERPQPSLHCRYTTSVGMSKLHQFYSDLLKSNGFTIVGARLSTGNTVTGVQQNANGYIDSMLQTSSLPNGPSIQIRVSYSRFYLNEPITVGMNVTVYPGIAK